MNRRTLLLSGLAALGFALATHTLARRTRPDHRYASVFTRRLQDRPTDTERHHALSDHTTFNRITDDTHESASTELPAGAVATAAQPSP